MNVVTISRDPFAREDLIRVKADVIGSCAWCGRKGKFRYGVWRDGIRTRPEFDSHLFCSVSCYRTFWGC